MIRYTDISDTLIIRGVDLSTATKVWATYRQAQRVQVNRYQTDTAYVEINVDDPTVTVVGGDTFIEVGLMQDQTGSFSVDSGNPVFVQVNFIKDGKRGATKAKAISIYENLHQEVVVSG